MANRGIAMTWAATDLPGELPAGGPNLEILPMQGWNGLEERTGLPFPLWGARSLRRLRRAVDDADLVHVHDGLYLGSHWATKYARSTREPVLLTQHIGEIPFPGFARRTAMKIANLALTRRQIRRSDAIVFVSSSVEEFFRGVPSRARRAVIANGVDLSVFQPSVEGRNELRRRLGIDVDRPAFLFVGRFVDKKGLPLLRRAAEDFPQVLWLFAGRGPIDPRQWGLSNVRVLGFLPEADIVSWYRGCDLTVLPSIGEGFPLVVQESMACGTPCLVAEETRLACPPVSDILLSAGFRAKNFLAACAEAVSSPERLRALGVRAAQEAKRIWSWEICLDRYLEIYRDLSARPFISEREERASRQ